MTLFTIGKVGVSIVFNGKVFPCFFNKKDSAISEAEYERDRKDRSNRTESIKLFDIPEQLVGKDLRTLEDDEFDEYQRASENPFWSWHK